MKSLVVTFLLISVMDVTKAESQPPLKDKKERISYALGAYIGDYWKRQGLQPEDVDWSSVISGFHAQLFDTPVLMSDHDIREAIRNLGSELVSRHYDNQAKLAQKNRKASDAFLAQNKVKPGVVSRASGLQYKVIAEGAGSSPTTNDSVVVNYRTTTIDGKEIDNSATHKPADSPVPVSGTKGWVEALQLMKPGAKWQVVVPPELAHGERGSYPLIPPNAALVYDIELVSCQPGAKSKEAAIPVNQAGVDDVIRIPSADELKKGSQIEVIKPDQNRPSP
jgi:FKBP-type peptidyl-prolyl cis-trans isomerase FklB